jgi:hypothetical protein
LVFFPTTPTGSNSIPTPSYHSHMVVPSGKRRRWPSFLPDRALLVLSSQINSKEFTTHSP